MLSWYMLSMGTDPTTKYNYEKIYAEPTCFGKDAICAIRTYDDGHNYPIITAQLRLEMFTALWNNAATPNVRLHYGFKEQEFIEIDCRNYIFNTLATV